MSGGAGLVPARLRAGIDLGGTKIAGLVLAPNGNTITECRRAAPREDYAETVRAIGAIVSSLEQSVGEPVTVGIGMPGSLSPSSGCVQNANSTWLNGKPLADDLEAHLRRKVRLANDANCFALSEAVDGAGAGARSVFGVILGTGCGGGLVFEGRLVDGPRGIGGEWGHNPLPWAGAHEHPGPACWCGRNGCMETWVSGPALAADHQRVTGDRLTPEEIESRAADGDAACKATLERHARRLARGLAHVINIFDPEIVVLGGGLSKLRHLYEVLPDLIAPFVFAERAAVSIKPPRWGDASGARGAAWLWN
jgi:fructokinase